MKKNGFAPIIILILIVLVGVGAYYFGITKNKTVPSLVVPVQPSSSPVAQPTADSTANWKTYTNTTYGYSFKYPPEDPDRPGVYKFTDNSVSIPGIDNINFKIDYLASSVQDPIEWWKQQTIEPLTKLPASDFNIVKPGVTIDNASTLTLNIKEGKCEYGCWGDYHFVTNNNNLFEIRSDSEEADQILSTFKFTK